MTTEVHEILSKRNDYYHVLGVSHHATLAEIKSAYKRQALKWHPDKNSHPKADEVFKLCSTAYSVLSDAEKKSAYDKAGVEGVQRQESGMNPQQQQRYRNGNYAQDPFEAFFGRGFQNGNNNNAHVQHVEINPNMVLLVPLFLFLLLAMGLSSSMQHTTSDVGRDQSSKRLPQFSLLKEMNIGLTTARTTNSKRYPGLIVTYYVGAQFQQLLDYGYVDLNKLELQVLRQNRDSLEKRCQADVLKRRSKPGSNLNSDVCDEFQRYRIVT